MVAGGREDSDKDNREIKGMEQDETTFQEHRDIELDEVIANRVMHELRTEQKKATTMINRYNEYKKSIVRNLFFFIVPFVGSFILIYFSSRLLYLDDFDGFEVSSRNIIIWLIISAVFGVIVVLYMQCYYDYIIGRYKLKLVWVGIEDAKEDIDDDIYKNLIKISYKYLDEYYLQTRDQAKKGFWVTVLVSVIGACIVAVGIAAMFLGKTTPAYVTTASGILTEFIAAVFFYLYNKTISSMNNYHNKLVLSQNISIALKIAESLPEDEGKIAKSKIVEELVKDINTHIHMESNNDNKE